PFGVRDLGHRSTLTPSIDVASNLPPSSKLPKQSGPDEDRNRRHWLRHQVPGCGSAATSTGSIRTATPLSTDIPARRSRSAASLDISSLTFAPPDRLASCQPPL